MCALFDLSKQPNRTPNHFVLKDGRVPLKFRDLARIQEPTETAHFELEEQRLAAGIGQCAHPAQ